MLGFPTHTTSLDFYTHDDNGRTGGHRILKSVRSLIYEMPSCYAVYGLLEPVGAGPTWPGHSTFHPRFRKSDGFPLASSRSRMSGWSLSLPQIRPIRYIGKTPTPGQALILQLLKPLPGNDGQHTLVGIDDTDGMSGSGGDSYRVVPPGGALKDRVMVNYQSASAIVNRWWASRGGPITDAGLQALTRFNVAALRDDRPTAEDLAIKRLRQLKKRYGW